MAQDIDDVIAELEAAKANLARSVKRCRTFLGSHPLPPVTVDGETPSDSAFGWQRTKG